jgi:hypothetical protein
MCLWRVYPVAGAMLRSIECNVITFTEAGLWPAHSFTQPAPTLPRYLKFGAREGNAIGLFDPETERITEWQLATPWSAPYDVVPDDHGEVWAGGMFTDRVARLDPKTGQITEYLLLRPPVLSMATGMARGT